MSGTSEYFEKRKRWQGFMYRFNSVVATGGGLSMVFAQKQFKRIMGWPYDDPVMMGTCGSLVTAIGLLSAIASRDDSDYVKYLPVLYIQIIYKSLTCGFLGYRLARNRDTSPAVKMNLLFFAAYVLALIKAIPWRGE